MDMWLSMTSNKLKKIVHILNLMVLLEIFV